MLSLNEKQCPKCLSTFHMWGLAIWLVFLRVGHLTRLTVHMSAQYSASRCPPDFIVC